MKGSLSNGVITALILINVLFLAILLPSFFPSHLDSCAKKDSLQNYGRTGRIAVVRPFVPDDLQILFEEMKRWNNSETFPCEPQSIHKDIDLIFLYRYNLEEDPHYRRLLLTETKRYGWASCFRIIDVISADVKRGSQFDIDETRHESIEQGKMVALIFQKHLLEKLDYFFFMGIESRPIRRDWLHKFYEECFFDHDFWMKGSLYQGQKYVPKRNQQDHFNYFLNGDAIYNLQSREFYKFLEFVIDKDQMKNPLDVAIWKAGLSKYTISQRWIQKFMYSPFIIHLGSSGYSQSELLGKYADTYIVRKRVECSECEPVGP